MARPKKSTALIQKNASPTKIQCHFISNTHWDREWRYSAQRTRYMLVSMLDMLMDIFEKEPDFRYFHMDSQTMPIQDYLEACPEKEPLIRKYISEGRLFIGPWFCLPDEFIVGGESLVRNLLLGHKIARRFGPVSKTGYSPFSWGQISQMPQIYQGFGIDVASFYRGINPVVAPKSEWIWEGADGTRIIASRLGARPRYNVWYVIHRPVFWGEENENNRWISWSRGNGLFHFMDVEKSEFDYQYMHPAYQYLQENVTIRAEQAIREQDADWTTPHRFWSEGHDSSCPDIREVKLIEDCNESLGDSAEVFHSTVKAWQDGLRAHKNEDWPVICGEMRHLQTKGGAAGLFGWVISSRMYIKQENFKTERLLTQYAEPLTVFASLLGAVYPQNFVDLAYNWLLQNHGHDTIAGCGRDITAEDAMYRFRQSREISNCILERALIDVAGSVDLSSLQPQDMAVLVYNPASFQRSETMRVMIDIPLEWKCKGFEIVDGQGQALPMQKIKTETPLYPVVQSPNDVANVLPTTRNEVLVTFDDLPGFGYKTYRVRPVKDLHIRLPKSLLSGPHTMENEFLSVSLLQNGTLEIQDKTSGQVYSGLGYFKDRGEVGNPWEHIPPMEDTVFTTLNLRPEITLIRDGELEASFQVKFDWSLPKSRSAGDKSRSEQQVPFSITNIVTLRKGRNWVEIDTLLENTAEDHYLQACFPTGFHFDHVMAQGQFDVLKRPVTAPYHPLSTELPMTEAPMNSFVDASDGKVGLALLNEGMKAYEAQAEPHNTINLTLLRAYPLRICVTQEMTDYSQIDKGSQCLGNHHFHYAVMPHAGDWEEGQVWKAAERFNLSLQACQMSPTNHGTEPLEKSFLEVQPAGLHVSAVKRSENGKGWVVRLFNPVDKEISGTIRLNTGYSGPQTAKSPVELVQTEFTLPRGKGKPWQVVRSVTLEELPEKPLPMDEAGWVHFEIGRKKISTIEFIPEERRMD